VEDFPLLKPEEVAKVTPYQWARRRVLPYYRLGEGKRGTMRFKMEDIKAFVEARRVEKKG
jgi:excisionase family DNA binding protein